MTVYYCNDDGSNTSPYDTMAKAATSIATLDSVASAGDTILVGHDHAEGSTGTLDLDFTGGTITNPVKIISANTSTSAYQRGGKIDSGPTSGIITLSGHICVEGVEFETEYYFQLLDQGDRKIFRDCKFTITRASGTVMLRYLGGLQTYHGGETELIDCDFDWTGSACASLFNLAGGGRVKVRGGTVTAGTSLAAVVDAVYNATYGPIGNAVIEYLDISGLGTSNILDGDAAEVTLRRCKLPTSYSLLGSVTTPFSKVLVENSAVGTISVPPLGLTAYEDIYGSIATTGSVYRTDGASDGETPCSWEMITTASAAELYQPLASPPISRWVDGGSSVTVTMYLAGGVTLNDDDFWIEISSPDETASPNQTALGNFYSSRGTPEATPTALTTDSGSTWNGSGVGTQQKISRTFTPTEPGPITIRCFLAKPSTTLYVDPLIEVT